MSDIKIDPVLVDITFVNGELVTGSVTDDIKQRVKDSLSTLIGEWVLDLTYGFDFRNLLFIPKNPSLPVAEAAIKIAILDAANNNLPSNFNIDITDFSMSLDRINRIFSVSYTMALGSTNITDTLVFNP